MAATAESDHDLIARSLAGEGEAFGVLGERYERAVYNLALRTMRDSRRPKTQPKRRF